MTKLINPDLIKLRGRAIYKKYAEFILNNLSKNDLKYNPSVTLYKVPTILWYLDNDGDREVAKALLREDPNALLETASKNEIIEMYDGKTSIFARLPAYNLSKNKITNEPMGERLILSSNDNINKIYIIKLAELKALSVNLNAPLIAGIAETESGTRELLFLSPIPASLSGTNIGRTDSRIFGSLAPLYIAKFGSVYKTYDDESLMYLVRMDDPIFRMDFSGFSKFRNYNIIVSGLMPNAKPESINELLVNSSLLAVYYEELFESNDLINVILDLREELVPDILMAGSIEYVNGNGSVIFKARPPSLLSLVDKALEFDKRIKHHLTYVLNKKKIIKYMNALEVLTAFTFGFSIDPDSPSAISKLLNDYELYGKRLNVLHTRILNTFRSLDKNNILSFRLPSGKAVCSWCEDADEYRQQIEELENGMDYPPYIVEKVEEKYGIDINSDEIPDDIYDEVIDYIYSLSDDLREMYYDADFLCEQCIGQYEKDLPNIISLLYKGEPLNNKTMSSAFISKLDKYIRIITENIYPICPTEEDEKCADDYSLIIYPAKIDLYYASGCGNHYADIEFDFENEKIYFHYFDDATVRVEQIAEMIKKFCWFSEVKTQETVEGEDVYAVIPLNEYNAKCIVKIMGISVSLDVVPCPVEKAKDLEEAERIKCSCI